MAIELTEQEQQTLVRWARRHTSSQALALRCRIVLGCAEGLPNTAVARREGCHPVTVSKWRRRFAEDRVATRPVEAVVVDTLENRARSPRRWRYPVVRQRRIGVVAPSGHNGYTYRPSCGGVSGHCGAELRA